MVNLNWRLLAILVINLHLILAQQRNESVLLQARAGCIYSYNFNGVGERATLNSENWPNSYGDNLECRYSFSSPPGTLITFECPTYFNIENSQNCVYDSFFWSLNGDPQFRDRLSTCGSSFVGKQTSNSNKLEIGFHSDSSNPTSRDPYRYQCRLDVISAPPSCSCGRSGSRASTRIVGGVEAAIGEFPWRVALFVQSKGKVFCGGSLISNSWILTSAHCTDDLITTGETIYADIGDHDVTIPNEATNKIIAVDRIIQNSRYNPNTQDNDTSLLHLSQPVAYAKNIQPVCLPWKYRGYDFDNVLATISGWGTTTYSGKQSDQLRKVDLDIVETQTCRNFYKPKSIIITDNMICAYRKGKDACQSDSGGSLDYFDGNTGQYYAMGIVSFGIGCAKEDYPGVYAKLANYLEWIQQSSGETFCKE